MGVSCSGNVALYPALAFLPRWGWGCAWYEYSSPDVPTRSDIWYAESADGRQWGEPINVSGGISYNNGPTLAIRRSGERVMAWHSWRVPGREPFTSGGGQANIWTAVCRNGCWSDPIQPVAAVPGTKYPSLAEHPDGRLYLFFIGWSDGKLRGCMSADGMCWNTPGELQGLPPGVGQPDLAIDATGRFTLVVAEREGCISHWLSDDGIHWHSRREVSFGTSGMYRMRPKVSVGEDGKIYVTAHTSCWGSFLETYEIKHKGGTLDLCFSARGGPGAAHWTINTIEIDGDGTSLRYRFGPVISPEVPGYVRVGADTPHFRPEHRAFGFDGGVEDLLRELGDALTKPLVHGAEPRRFRVELPSGCYTVRIVHSSWIASMPSTRVAFEATVVRRERPEPQADRCSLAELRPDGGVACCDFPAGACADHNRPSRYIPLGVGGQVAWTTFDGHGVAIKIAKLSAPGDERT